MTSSNQDIKTNVVVTLVCRREVRASCFTLRGELVSMLALEKIYFAV